MGRRPGNEGGQGGPSSTRREAAAPFPESIDPFPQRQRKRSRSMSSLLEQCAGGRHGAGGDRFNGRGGNDTMEGDGQQLHEAGGVNRGRVQLQRQDGALHQRDRTPVGQGIRMTDDLCPVPPQLKGNSPYSLRNSAEKPKVGPLGVSLSCTIQFLQLPCLPQFLQLPCLPPTPCLQPPTSNLQLLAYHSSFIHTYSLPHGLTQAHNTTDKVLKFGCSRCRWSNGGCLSCRWS